VTRGKGLIMSSCAALALLAGCASQEPGTPTASGDPTSATKTSTGSSTSTRSSTSQPSDVDPCDLLSSSDVTSLGLAAGKPQNVGGEKTCSWLASGKFSIRIGFSKNGLDGINGQSVPVGKHQAIQFVESQFGGCVVAMGISANSSALVVAVPNSGDPAATCPQAVSTAKIIDPKLP
jgi:hypothetical protein